MKKIRLAVILCVACVLGSAGALAGVPKVGAPLPTLKIAERGELTMSGDDFSYVPWTSETNPGKVHVIQYFGANLGDRDVFQPFTDLLQESVEPGAVHVSTVLNMDAALWGTTGFVLSELEKNKKMHPLATMVLDEEGTGVDTWELGEDGTGLIVMDDKGVVQYFKRSSLNEEERTSTLELIRSLLGGLDN
jgi:YtfJ family uncharacterized protein